MASCIEMATRGPTCRQPARRQHEGQQCPSGPRSSGSQRMSPPAPLPGDPGVVAVLNPPNRRHLVQPSHRSPPATQLPQHPVDARRPLKPPASRLDRPRSPRNLLPTESKPLDQPRLLVGPNGNPSPPIAPLYPPSKTLTELALAVVHQGQSVIRHVPKLHCLR